MFLCYILVHFYCYLFIIIAQFVYFVLKVKISGVIIATDNYSILDVLPLKEYSERCVILASLCEAELVSNSIEYLCYYSDMAQHAG